MSKLKMKKRWCEEDMVKALADVDAGVSSIRGAAKNHGVAESVSNKVQTTTGYGPICRLEEILILLVYFTFRTSDGELA